MMGRMQASSVLRALTVLLLAAMLLPGAALAQESITAEPLTPAEVVALPDDSDGETILIQGEAIGESLHADEGHRWVNLLSDGTAIGVYMTNEDAEKITTFGQHKVFGDSVRVVGVLHRWCPEHAGEFDIHAEEVTIVSEGQERETLPRPWKALFGALLAVVGLIEYRYFRYLKEHASD